jgi:uracil phosphoribosyltransferase
MVKILSEKNSLISTYLSEIRDIDVQKDSQRFRTNFERIGEIFAYEISKYLEYDDKEVVTPLGMANTKVLREYPVIASILRAGLPLHNGMLRCFDRSENAFIAAYRKHHKDGNFDIQVEYVSSPDLTDRVLILSDPMLATGASMVLTYKDLLLKGKPSHTHIVTILASVQGIEYCKKHLSRKDVTIWVGAVDDELTAQAYIVPGLGDAGDLAFGSKV